MLGTSKTCFFSPFRRRWKVRRTTGFACWTLRPAWCAHEYVKLALGVVPRLTWVLFVDDVLDNRIGIGLECLCFSVLENRLGINLGETNLLTHRTLCRTGALRAVRFATLATAQPPHLPFIEK